MLKKTLSIGIVSILLSSISIPTFASIDDIVIIQDEYVPRYKGTIDFNSEDFLTEDEYEDNYDEVDRSNPIFSEGYLDNLIEEVQKEMDRKESEDTIKKQEFEKKLKSQNLTNKIIRVIMDGEDITYKFSQYPEVISGRTMVPMRVIFESLGADVTWDGNTQTVVAVRDEFAGQKITTVTLKVGSKNAKIDLKQVLNMSTEHSENKTLDIAPMIRNGSLMVPLRFVSESLGAGVLWDSTNNKVLIFSPDNSIEYSLAKDELEREKNLQKNSGSNSPLDSLGKPIKVGATVGCGGFSGTVKQIKGSKIQVYWYGYNKGGLIEDTEESINYWSILTGVKYQQNQWIESNEVKVKN